MKKIKIKSINKKLLSGALALTLMMVSLTGCSQEETTFDTGFEYSSSEQGEYQASGSIGFYELKDCYFLEICNQELNSSEFYIAVFVNSSGMGANRDRYYNLLTGKLIIETNGGINSIDEESNRALAQKIKLEDYLYALDEIHGEYKQEDITRILDRMQEIDFSDDKELVKK